jgi:ubiquinone/menaquinone biosynthesis C-methylase UbiE
MRKTHRDIESAFDSSCHFSTVCEVGAGNGKHLDFVSHKYDSYIMVDIREMKLEKKEPRIKTLVGDATSLPLGENSVDRLIAMCLLPHLSEPWKALENWRTVVRNDGYVSIFLSCDPSLLIRLNRKLIMTPSLRRRGFKEYPLLNAIEHRNHFSSLWRMVKEVYKEDEITIKRKPFNVINSWNLNAYWIIQVKVIK